MNIRLNEWWRLFEELFEFAVKEKGLKMMGKNCITGAYRELYQHVCVMWMSLIKVFLTPIWMLSADLQ